jgi:primosomal protein N' (replication factor Y)
MKAQVLLPKIFNYPFTYNSNQSSLKVGDLVEVPFGNNKEIGVVWPGQNTGLKNIKIKNISKKINNFSLEEDLINFINWFAAYNMMPLGLVLKMTIGTKLNFFDNSDKNFEKKKQK